VKNSLEVLRKDIVSLNLQYLVIDLLMAQNYRLFRLITNKYVILFRLDLNNNQ